MPIIRVADVAERIEAKRKLYRTAMAAELALLRRQHGVSVVADALALLKQPRHDDRAAVARAVARVVAAEKCWPLK